MVKENWAAGLWVFAENVPLPKILEAASGLSINDKYPKVHVRLALKNQYAIEFIYALDKPSNTMSGQETNVKKTQSHLKKLFGAGLVAHDIATPVYKIL